jgi:DNA adenine methylase
MKEIKSPLRYPGGKSKAIPKILEYLPLNFVEYREPFVGGGSLFIYLKQKKPNLKVWINDLNYDLVCFWKCAQRDIDQLVDRIWQIKKTRTNGKRLFEDLLEVNLSCL